MADKLSHPSLMRIRLESSRFQGSRQAAPAGTGPARRDGLLALPDGTRMVGKEAYRGREDIASLFLPQGVEEIGDYAFCDCKNLAAALLPGQPGQLRGIAPYQRRGGRQQQYRSCTQQDSLVGFFHGTLPSLGRMHVTGAESPHP